jgi:hypothetical protein
LSPERGTPAISCGPRVRISLTLIAWERCHFRNLLQTLSETAIFSTPSIKIIQVHELNQSSLTSAFLQSNLQASHNELLEQVAANCVISRRRLHKADDICNS